MNCAPLLAFVSALALLSACALPPSLDAAADSEDLGRGLRPGFLFGAATSAHQIEGGQTNSDWWEWEHTRQGDTSESGAGSWGRFETADLPLLEELGANAYRLSVEWSRLEPERGAWDTDAAAQYREFVAALRQHGIEPMVTLHHFTLPRWVADQGGFENPKTLDDFDEFVGRVATLLGAEVDLWCTVNEPNVYVFQGYVDGIWPPGRHDTRLAAEVMGNLLAAHARATLVLRTQDTVDANGDGAAVQSGIAHHVRVFQPASSSALDVTITGITDDFFNESIVRAAKTGRYQVSVPGTVSIDREIPNLAGSFDYLGLNYYTRDHVRADLGDPSLSNQYVPEARPRNDLGWELYPEGLYQFATRFAALGWPIYVTENGLADAEGNLRPEFLRRHLAALELATKQGVDLRGYFHWSLMDNFEWADGYAPRFGLFRVDRDNPELPRQATPAVETFRLLACNAGASTRPDCAR